MECGQYTVDLIQEATMTGRTVTKHVEWIKNNSELKWARLKGMERISDKVIPYLIAFLDDSLD